MTIQTAVLIETLSALSTGSVGKLQHFLLKTMLPLQQPNLEFRFSHGRYDARGVLECTFRTLTHEGGLG